MMTLRSILVALIAYNVWLVEVAARHAAEAVDSRGTVSLCMRLETTLTFLHCLDEELR
jgi:hypothetical protein